MVPARGKQKKGSLEKPPQGRGVFGAVLSQRPSSQQSREPPVLPASTVVTSGEESGSGRRPALSRALLHTPLVPRHTVGLPPPVQGVQPILVAPGPGGRVVVGPVTLGPEDDREKAPRPCLVTQVIPERLKVSSTLPTLVGHRRTAGQGGGSVLILRVTPSLARAEVETSVSSRLGRGREAVGGLANKSVFVAGLTVLKHVYEGLPTGKTVKRPFPVRTVSVCNVNLDTETSGVPSIRNINPFFP